MLRAGSGGGGGGGRVVELPSGCLHCRPCSQLEALKRFEVGRETWTPVADSCQCIAKSTTIL